MDHRIYKFSLLILLSQSYYLISNNNLDYKKLVEHVEKSIQNAEKGISKINNDILNIHGLSSPKVRHFLNNLCSLKGTYYLEVGAWQGSTFVSALYGNHRSIKQAIGIDNLSEDFMVKGIKEKLYNNLKNFLNFKYNYKFLEQDSFKTDLSAFKNKINIYFYDGDHHFEQQKKAFTYFDSILDDLFIAVVDDYNVDWIQNATQEAFKELKYKVLYEKYLPSKANGDLENWWNGLYVAVIEKNKK